MGNNINTYKGDRMHKEEDRLEVSSILDQEILCADDVLLVPRQGILSSRSEAEIKPYIYSSPMDVVTGYNMTKTMVENGEFPVVCRYLKNEWDKALVEYHGNPSVFFAIGSKKQDIEELLEKLNEIKTELYDDDQKIAPLSVAVDIAHGDTRHAHALYKWLSEQPFIGNIMSGSVCTADGAMRAYEAGCTHIRVGIGPGSACTTRLMTGCGMPQLTAVYFAAKAVAAIATTPYAIIADGGIRNPGDANKYLAAGATGVMMGRAFSECEESAGWRESLLPNETAAHQHTGTVSFPLQRPATRLAKQYRGQASASFQTDMFGKANVCPEGATSGVIYPTKTCQEVLDYYRGGLSSAISYLGLSSSSQLEPKNVIFIKVPASAQQEGVAHGCE